MGDFIKLLLPSLLLALLLLPMLFRLRVPLLKLDPLPLLDFEKSVSAAFPVCFKLVKTMPRSTLLAKSDLRRGVMTREGGELEKEG